MKRWRARGRPSGGRLESPGHDHRQGHLTYVSKAGPEGANWLRTKPFSAPPSYELARCLHSFAHIVERLKLGVRAQVLDVGCGPGWLSEYLARCGYWVVGVDISPDMIEIARQRVAAIDGPIAGGIDAQAEFFAMPVREMPWRERFDAAILYDTMHHFDEELETLRTIRRTLVPGGRIYIHEGVRPPPGSETERALIAEMEQHGTLESPFDPDYLLWVVEQAGFVDVTRLVELDELFDLSEPAGALQRTRDRLEQPDTNTLLAATPIPLEAKPDRTAFTAHLEPGSSWRPSADGREVSLALTVTNTGLAFWPVAVEFPFPQGSVTIGAYVVSSTGERRELARAPLPHGVAPGESVSVELRVPRSAVTDESEIKVEPVREGIAWFSDLGFSPLVVPLTQGA